MDRSRKHLAKIVLFIFVLVVLVIAISLGSGRQSPQPEGAAASVPGEPVVEPAEPPEAAQPAEPRPAEVEEQQNEGDDEASQPETTIEKPAASAPKKPAAATSQAPPAPRVSPASTSSLPPLTLALDGATGVGAEARGPAPGVLWLSGVIQGQPRLAVIRRGQNRYMVREGDTFEGQYRVATISSNSVTLQRGRRKLTLRLGQY